jgi:DoxX-like family
MTDSANSRTAVRLGWILTGLVTLTMIANGLFSIFGESFAREALEQMVTAGGFSMDKSAPLGVIMLICGIVYAIPRTAVLGAILMTGFVGGAICTEYRIGLVASASQLTNLALGLMTWAGLYCRDAKVRALLPFVRAER